MIRLSGKGLLLASVFSAIVFGFPHAVEAKEGQKQAIQMPRGSDVMLRVEGKNITRDDIETAVGNLMPRVSYHQSVSDEKYRGIRQKAVDNIINSELIYRYAKGKKFAKVTDKDIDKEIKALKKSLPKGETLEDVLKRSKITMKDLREDYRKNLTVAAISKDRREEFRNKAEATVTEKHMRDYYDKNLNKFKQPEQIHLSSILIKADPSGGTAVWNEARKRTDEIVKLAKSGKDFAKLAEEHSEDPNAKRGGDMGWAHKGSLFPEIEQAVEGAKTGDIVGPVMTIFGYHAVRVEGRKPSVQKKFEELNLDKLRAELQQKENKRLWDEWIKGMRDSAKIETVRALD